MRDSIIIDGALAPMLAITASAREISLSSMTVFPDSNLTLSTSGTLVNRTFSEVTVVRCDEITTRERALACMAVLAGAFNISELPPAIIVRKELREN